MAKRTCKGKNTAGKACKAAPLKDRDYCRAHDQNRPDDDRFGSSAWSARAGASEKPRVPKLTEELQRRVEEEAEAIVGVLFAGLEASRGLTLRIGGGQDELVETPDHAARIAAARELFDRAVGRPRQALEHSGPEGGPIETSAALDIGDPETRRLAHELLERQVRRAE